MPGFPYGMICPASTRSRGDKPRAIVDEGSSIVLKKIAITGAVVSGVFAAVAAGIFAPPPPQKLPATAATLTPSGFARNTASSRAGIWSATARLPITAATATAAG